MSEEPQLESPASAIHFQAWLPCVCGSAISVLHRPPLCTPADSTTTDVTPWTARSHICSTVSAFEPAPVSGRGNGVERLYTPSIPLSPKCSSLLIALFGFSSHPSNLPDGNKTHSRWQLSSHFDVMSHSCCEKVIDTVINSSISIFPIPFCPQQTLYMKLFFWKLFPACSWRCSRNDLKTDNTAVISQGSPAMLWWNPDRGFDGARFYKPIKLSLPSDGFPFTSSGLTKGFHALCNA